MSLQRQILLAVVLSLLVACDEAKLPQISESDASLLDAIAFIVGGIEEGKTPRNGIEPIQRVINQTGIAYTLVAKNTFEEARDSKFVKLTLRLSSPEACLFRLELLQAFSKGETSNDFDSALKNLGAMDYDLKKASRFEVEAVDLGTTQGSLAHIILEGRGVECAEGKCKDKTIFSIYDHDSEKPTWEQRDLILRRQRAISFVQKTCPGKPY